MAPPKVPVDVPRLLALLQGGASTGEACEAVGIHESTLYNRLRTDAALKGQVDAARAMGRGAAGRASESGPTIELGRTEQLKLGEVAVLLGENGLDPDEWTVDGAVVNKWGQPGEESRQVKVKLRPRTWIDSLRPAADVSIRAPKQRRPVAVGEPETIVFVSDHHAPYVDEALHEASLALIAAVQPHRVVHGGDLLDLPTISRHRDDPSMAATPQECIDAGYRILRDLREAAGDAWMGFIPGNHDDRLRTEVLTRSERLFGVAPAPTEEEPEPIAAMSLRRLLHLDALGVELHGARDGGEYHHGEIRIGDTLVMRHGWITGRDPAGRTMETLGSDVIVGHTHHQRQSYATKQWRGQSSVMVGVEAGCMCATEVGYMPARTANWQQGFVVAHVYPGGHGEYTHARWDGTALMWRGQSWR